MRNNRKNGVIIALLAAAAVCIRIAAYEYSLPNAENGGASAGFSDVATEESYEEDEDSVTDGEQISETLDTQSKASESSAEKDDECVSAAEEIVEENSYPDYYSFRFAADYFMADNEDLRKVYDDIYYGISMHEENIEIRDGVIKSEDFGDFFDLVSACGTVSENLGSSYRVFYSDSGYVTGIEVSYLYTSGELEEQYAALLKKADSIVAGAADSMSDYEKIIYLHDQLINSCEYDKNAANPSGAYGALCDGRAVCEGYAKAFELLCGLSGIDCLPVIGQAYGDDGESSGHMWNKVLLDGQWYNIDCTWDDPETGFPKYDYLLVGDQDLVSTHNADGGIYMSFPEASVTDGTYFDREGLVLSSGCDLYSEYYNGVLRCFNGEIPDNTVRFRFNGDGLYEEAVSFIYDVPSGAYESGLSSILRELSGNRTGLGYYVVENEDLNIISLRIEM